MKKAITLFSLSLLMAGVFAQTSPAWVKYSGPSDYANYDVREVSTATDTLGNVYTAASMSDTLNNLSKAMLVKYNPAGVQQWIQYYDNNDVQYNGTYIKKLLVDRSGNAFLCGYGVGGSTGGKDFFLAKYDNNGNQQWNAYLDGGSAGDDYVTSAAFDTTGNIIMAGYANHGAGTTGDDIYVTKWSATGTLLWNYLWNNASANDEDRALDVATDRSGNVFVTGSTYQTSTGRDMVTIKLDGGGNNLWTKIYSYGGDNNDDRGFSVVTDSLGNSYVTGATANWNILKYSPTGTVLWEVHYTTFDLERYSAKKVLLDKAGNVITVGSAFQGQPQQDNYVINKYTSAGLLLWSTDVNSPAGGGSVEEMYDAVVDTAGYIYVTGKYDGPAGADILTAVISPSGAKMWNNPFTNNLNPAGGDLPYSIVIDRYSNIFIAGVSETRTTSADAVDVVTFKYNALNFSTGVTDIALQDAEMLVYPNPTQNTLNIHLSDESLLGAAITVTNLLGQTIITEKIDALNLQLDLSAQAKGIYTVSVKTAQATASKKIIIQ